MQLVASKSHGQVRKKRKKKKRSEKFAQRNLVEQRREHSISEKENTDGECCELGIKLNAFSLRSNHLIGTEISVLTYNM